MIYEIKEDSKSINLAGFGCLNNTWIKMEIPSMLLANPSYLILDNDQYYFTNAAPFQYPNSAVVGDLQLQLNKNISKYTMFYQMENIVCELESCNVKCKSPIPAIRRLREKIKEGKLNPVSIIEAEKTVITKQSFQNSIDTTIFKLDPNKVQDFTGSCKINLIYTSLEHLWFETSKVKNNGLMDFETNCSIKYTQIDCSKKIFNFDVEHLNHFCYLKVVQTKQFVQITKKLYDFEGEIMTNDLPIPFQHESLIDIFYSSYFIITLIIGVSIMICLIFIILFLKCLKKLTNKKKINLSS